LHGIDVAAAALVEFVLDHVEQPAMQPFDQRQGLEIQRPDVVEARLTFGGLDRLGNGFHVQRPLRLFVYAPVARPCLPRSDDATLKGAV